MLLTIFSNLYSDINTIKVNSEKIQIIQSLVELKIAKYKLEHKGNEGHVNV